MIQKKRCMMVKIKIIIKFEFKKILLMWVLYEHILSLHTFQRSENHIVSISTLNPSTIVLFQNSTSKSERFYINNLNNSRVLHPYFSIQTFFFTNNKSILSQLFKDQMKSSFWTKANSKIIPNGNAQLSKH